VKRKLLASSSSMEEIKKAIGKYWYSNSIELVPELENIWKVKNGNGIVEEFYVILKQKRYRFEYWGTNERST
jgi:hypothetical protein